MLNLVLYQPDIPQNLGAILRLSACMGCVVHIIEPCGFPLDHAKLRRAGMDYIDKARYHRHLNWDAFLKYRREQDETGLRRVPPRAAAHASGGMGSALSTAVATTGRGGNEHTSPPSRLLLLETDGETAYTDAQFTPTDYIILGSEGAGTPRALYSAMDAVITIPMRAGMRSLNMAMAAGMLVAEACRQMEWRME